MLLIESAASLAIGVWNHVAVTVDIQADQVTLCILYLRGKNRKTKVLLTITDVNGIANSATANSGSLVAANRAVNYMGVKEDSESTFLIFFNTYSLILY